VPLNILLADDSVPAQNMGKKILMDAGYHVLTVSNGLEALRKIADTKPDIAILDIFMPGYTGLEICERLRASPATATLPVILTVGKLEPYRSQDGEQVHSNAVIVKPFAAAELISAVHSLIGAPEADAESNPELVGQSHAEDSGAGPLQESPFGEIDFHNPLAIGHPAGQEEVPDEPLFSTDPSATRQDESPLAAGEPIAHGDGPFLSDVELDGADSFVFDPEAKHIPFSASAIDFLPVPSHSPAESGASAFSEFDLEPGPSHYSAAAEEGFSTVEGASPAAPAVVADAELDASQLSADLAVAQEEIASVPGDAAELEVLDVSFLDAPALDSLLEVHEDSTVLAIEEESRRLAFEELFNSDEPFPAESSPIEPAGSSIALLPSMADLSENHPFDVAPDSEIEPLIDNNRSGFIAPESDPYLMQEAGQSSVVGVIPERDVLLEDALEASWSVAASVPQPAESMVQDAGELHSLQAEERSELPAGSALDAVTAETQNFAVEAHATEPEILAPEYPAEAVQTFSEAVTEQAQFVPEVLQVASEVPVEKSQFVSEVLLSTAAEPIPEQVMHLETEAEPTAVQPDSAEPQSETQMAQSAPSPEASLQSSEAERIREAVDKVFDRFKRLLVAAIVRELARHD
jgi:CheY-like chemotaxis protein